MRNDLRDGKRKKKGGEPEEDFEEEEEVVQQLPPPARTPTAPILRQPTAPQLPPPREPSIRQVSTAQHGNHAHTSLTHASLPFPLGLMQPSMPAIPEPQLSGRIPSSTRIGGTSAAQIEAQVDAALAEDEEDQAV